MKKLLLSMMIVAAATPAWSQTKPVTRAARVDPCAPIGQTASRELIYSMSCTNLPAPPPSPPQAELQSAPAPEAEVRRGGLFGMSFDVGGNAPGGQGRTP